MLCHWFTAFFLPFFIKLSPHLALVPRLSCRPPCIAQSGAHIQASTGCERALAGTLTAMRCEGCLLVNCSDCAVVHVQCVCVSRRSQSGHWCWLFWLAYAGFPSQAYLSGNLSLRSALLADVGMHMRLLPTAGAGRCGGPLVCRGRRQQAHPAPCRSLVAQRHLTFPGDHTQ